MRIDPDSSGCRCGTVVVDVRRHFASGIGRVSLNLARAAVASHDLFDRVILFASSSTESEVRRLAGRDAEVRLVDYPFFSREDLFALPDLVAGIGADLYIAPQFYISPLLPCKAVKMIHDLWPILHDRWLPTAGEIAAHFGPAAATGAAGFLTWFEAAREQLPSWQYEWVRDLYEGNEHPIYRCMLAMYCAAVDTATRIPTCSEFSRQQIAAFFPEAASKLSILYPFVARRPHRGTTQEFAVLHVGKVEPRKNHRALCDGFIAAYERLDPGERRQASLTLIGDVSYRNIGRELSASIERASRIYPIRMRGIVPERELWAAYESARMFVFPSLFEGFGIPVIEAMSAGVPVITSAAGGTREAAGDAALLLDELSAESISEAMLRLHRDPALHRELTAAGLRRATDFSFSQMVEQFRRIVCEVAGHPRRISNRSACCGRLS